MYLCWNITPQSYDIISNCPKFLHFTIILFTLSPKFSLNYLVFLFTSIFNFLSSQKLYKFFNSIFIYVLQTLTLLNFTPLNNIYLATSQHSAIFSYHPIPLFLPYSHILYSIILTIFRYFDLININIYIPPIHILCYPIPVFYVSLSFRAQLEIITATHQVNL